MEDLDDKYKAAFSVGGIAADVEMSIVLDEIRESNAVQYWSITSGSSIISSPTIYKDTIYFGCNDGILYALSTTGQLKWKFLTGDTIVSSPVIHKEKIHFGSYDGNF